MSFDLSLVPWLIVAQVCGIGLAWRIDWWTWNWKQRQSKLKLSFHIGIVFLIVMVGAVSSVGIRNFAIGLVASAVWSCIVTSVQTRQYHEPWSRGFLGALYQCWLFAMGLIVSAISFVFVLVVLNAILSTENHVLPVYLFVASAIVTHLLFTFFRPTLDAGGRQFRSLIDERAPIKLRRTKREKAVTSQVD